MSERTPAAQLAAVMQIILDPEENIDVRRDFVIYLASCLILYLASCSPQPSQDEVVECTAIGCNDTLSIVLDGDLPSVYQIELEFEGKTLRVDCDLSNLSDDSPFKYHGDCNEWGVVFRGVSPNEAQVRISGDGLSYEGSISPIYETFRPNGPDCPPICRAGAANIQIP